MKLYSYLFKLFYFFIVISVFFACELPQQKTLTQTQKDSVLVEMLNEYAKTHQTKLQNTENKLLKIRELIKNILLKPFETAQRKTIQLPICSGNFRDSCSFKSANMALLISKEQLEHLPSNKDLSELTQIDGNGLINTFWAVQKQTYRPINATFKDTSFESVKKSMNSDLYNLQLFFDLKYLFVLETVLHTPPSNEYGGGKLKANYYMFDFQKIAYLGSLTVESENTPNYQPPTETTKEAEKIQERTYSNGKRTYTTRTPIKTQEKQSTSQATRYYYAEKDLLKNFKAEAQKKLNTFLCNEKGKDVSLYSVY